MRVVVNEKLVQTKAAAAQRAVIIGIGITVLAVVISFQPQYTLYAYLLLIPGLFLSNWAAYSGMRWLRNPRADQAMAKALKGLDHSYQLFSYVLPAEHVLLHPAGLMVLKVKLQDGKIVAKGDKWSRGSSLGRIFRALSSERLGNPTQQANQDVQKLLSFLEKTLPGVKVPVKATIVFVEPKVDLEASDLSIPAVVLGDLRKELRSAAGESRLPPETMRVLTQTLNELVK